MLTLIGVGAASAVYLGNTADAVIPKLAEEWGRGAIMDALGDTRETPGSYGLIPRSQRNPEWAGDLLGYSTGKWTMGNGGCALTSVTILASQVYKDLTPGQLNQKLKDAGAFDGAELDWTAVPRVLPALRYIHRRDWNFPVPQIGLDELREDIARYGPVILEVDFIPRTSKQEMHFVVALEVTNNDVRIIDPWDGAETWLMLRYAEDGQTLADAIWGTRVYQVREP